MKESCAKAALDLIRDGMVVGLGGGSTVALLIDKLVASQKKVQLVTPSADTAQLCQQKGLSLLNLEDCPHLDLAFDGCDELDTDLNALKSCGGIHSREKIMAAMADDYILLADQQKYQEDLTFNFPVALEVLPAAKSFVEKVLEDEGAQVSLRKSSAKAGYVISDDGNYLMDAAFTAVGDLAELAGKLDKLPGLVGHSLFYQVASQALIASPTGVKHLSKKANDC